MAFTKVVGAGIHTLSNIASHNINSSGIITATKFVGPFDGTNGDFSGNVTIDGNLTVNGTTTTLDTNLIDVDKIEVAANNSTVGVAITQSGTGDILNLYDGSSEVFSVADGGLVEVKARAADTKRVVLAGSPTNTTFQLAAYDGATGTGAGTTQAKFGLFYNTDENAVLKFERGSGASAGALTINTNNTEQLRFLSNGDIRASWNDKFIGMYHSSDYYMGATFEATGSTNRALFIDNRTANGRGDIIFRTGVNQAPVERLTIKGTGNVGIGTDAPDEKFQVQTGTHKFISFTDAEHGSLTTLGSAIMFSRPQDGAKKICGIFQHTNQSLGIGARDDLTFHTGGNAFYYSGSEKLRITSAGLVGIGTDNPGAQSTSANNLVVADFAGEGGITIKTNASSSGNIFFADTAGTATGRIAYGHGATDAGDYMRFYVNSEEKLRIDANGDVGINTTNPQDFLHIQATSGESTRFTGNQIKFNRASSFSYIDQYGAGDLAIRTTPSGSQLNRLVILSGGNIGIGEDAPSEKLQVKGDILLGSTGADTALKFEYNNHQFAKIVGNGRDSSGYGDIDFYTSSGSGVSNLTQRMTIRESGNIGIGTGLPSSLLHIKKLSGPAKITLESDDSNDAWINFSGATNEMSAGFDKGSNSFYITNHDTIASNQRVTITSGGKVGINEPSPSAFLTVRATTDDNPSIVLYRHSGGGDVASLNWKSSTGTNAFIKWRGGSGDMGMHFYTSNAGNDGSTSEKIRIASTGQLLVHTGSNASGSIVMGGNYDGLGQTNSTNKLGTLMLPHYTNAEEPIQMIRGYSDSTRNLVQMGGGTNSANAATEIELYTATSITGTGVARLSIDSNGKAVFSERTRTPQLGIGVEAQDHVHLHVQSADPRVLIKSTGTNASKIWFGDSGGTDIGIIEYQHTNDAMRFGTAGTEDRFVIKGDGKIAIGAPAFTADSALHIQTSGAYLTIEGTSASDNQGIRLNSTTANSQIWKAGSSNTGYGGANSLNIYNDNNHPIAFYQSTNKRGELASTGNWVLYTSLQMGSNNDGALMGKLGNKSFGSDVWGAGKGASAFYVYGDSDKYYPVELFPTVSAANTRIQVYRGYSEQAPNDWYTSTHKGGLTFDFSVRFGSWGGYTQHGPQIYYFGESYATIVGGLAYISHSMRYCIWLRGGGSGGAKYYIDSPSGNLSYIVHDDVTNTGTGQGYYYSDAGTAGAQNNGNTARGWATYYHSTAGYRYYVDYIGNSTTLTNSRNNLKQYNLTGAHTTHGGGAHNP